MFRPFSFYKLVFILPLFISCKYSKEHNKTAIPATQQVSVSGTKQVPKIENVKSQVIIETDFNVIKPFKYIENDNKYINNDTQLIIKSDNTFMLTKKDFVVDDIDLSESNYEGPGYNIFSFQSKSNSQFEIVVIEATADIGTDWYYVIILNNENLIDKFYIKEPRANSENTSIGDFIKISMKNDILNIKFKKDKIAKYSEKINNLKSDSQYYYLTKQIGNK